jgi:signal peptidase II
VTNLNLPAKEPPPKPNLVLAYISLLLLAGAIIVLDQITKIWVRNNLSLGESITPFPSLPFFRILHWQNTGAAFGLLQDWGGVFAILAVVVAVLIVVYFPRIEGGDWSLRLAMGLQLGGAVGNLLDRLQHGYVTDFVSVGNFAVFNVADTSITLGVGLLLLSIWLTGDPEEEPQEQGQEKLLQ